MSAATGAPFPRADDFTADAEVERDFEPVLAAILALRSFRGESGVPFGTRFTAHVLADEGIAQGQALRRYRELVQKLTNTDVVFGWSLNAPHAVLPGAGFEIKVPLEGIVDLAEERSRTEKEIARLEKEVAGIHGRLNNPKFMERAPADVVDRRPALPTDYSSRLKLGAHRPGSR